MLPSVQVNEKPDPVIMELAQRVEALESKTDERPLPILRPSGPNGTAFSQEPSKPSLLDKALENLRHIAD